MVTWCRQHSSSAEFRSKISQSCSCFSWFVVRKRAQHFLRLKKKNFLFLHVFSSEIYADMEWHRALKVPSQQPMRFLELPRGQKKEVVKLKQNMTKQFGGNVIILTETRLACLTENPVTIVFGDYFPCFYMEQSGGPNFHDLYLFYLCKA